MQKIPTSQKIKQRSQFLATIRQFFAQRHIYEVDTALLTAYGVTDLQLTSLPADNGYLITSPEYAMKQLLCAGAPDIYQLSHVFRGEEQGRKHRKEFMLLEWYRLNWTLQSLIEEVAELIQTLLPNHFLPVKYTPYAQLFQNTFHLNIFQTHHDDIAQLCQQSIPESRYWDLEHDDYLDLLFSHFIEPNLGKDCLEFILDYPSSQAALAKIHPDKNGHLVAARFEAYIDGIELCNGFDELANASEQRMRFEANNQARRAKQLPVMPIDEVFLHALATGLPPCTGVALGVDRLLMIATHAQHIDEVTL